MGTVEKEVQSFWGSVYSEPWPRWEEYKTRFVRLLCWWWPHVPGALGLDGHTGYHSGGLGRQEGESGPIRKRSGPSFGRAAVPQCALSDFRLWLCHANGSQSCSHCQVSPGICPLPRTGCLWRPFSGGKWALIVFHTHFYRPVMSTMLENGICGMRFKKNVLLVLDPFCVCEIAILY